VDQTENETTPGSAGADLVEPEGVNAASREITGEQEGRGDVTSGGAPERAADQMFEQHQPEQMVGTSDAQDDGPGQQLSVGEG
jgi:hypothetical protein